MDAFILHAYGDESFAQDMARRIAPTTSLDAPLAAAGAVSFGDHLVVIALWSARAEAQGLARVLADTARHVGDRCIVMRVDGTPLPALVGTAQIAVFNGRENEFAAILKVARMRARPAPAPVVAHSSGIAKGIGPGVGVGLAIYAGMFVAAGAWRSEDITQAIATDVAAPTSVALRSYQTVLDAPETAHVALASSTPTARFVQPQRVIVTASLDTSSAHPVIVARPNREMARIESVERAQPMPTPVIESAPLTPVASFPAESGAMSLSLIALDGLSTLDFAPYDAF